MNDKAKSKADTKIEAEELKGEALEHVQLEDKDLDQVTGGYLKITLSDFKSDGNEKTGVRRRKASSVWSQGDWNGDGLFDSSDVVL